MSTIKEAITTVASIMSIILWKNCFLKITNSNIYTMYQVSTTKFKTHKAEPVEQTDSSQITILFSTWNNKIRGMHRENKLYINQSQILFKVASKENIFKWILTVNVSKICITRFPMHFIFNGLRCQRRFFLLLILSLLECLTITVEINFLFIIIKQKRCRTTHYQKLVYIQYRKL